MKVADASIPLGLAWSSPFARWQGALAELDSLTLATAVTRDALDRGGLEPETLTGVILGSTVPQPAQFFGPTTLAGGIGAPGIGGPLISQACATSVVCLQTAALLVSGRPEEVLAVVTADRTSNGPLLVYPRPSGPGGAPATEHWVLDNFAHDPWADCAPVDTAERVADQEKISRAEIDEVALLRSEQYQRALADDRAFQRAYMVPVEVPAGRKTATVDADTGVIAFEADRLAALDPVTPGGVITYGSQTHPADASAGMLVVSTTMAHRLGGGGGSARILATGTARAGAGLMPKAPVPAAMQALGDAGLAISDLDAVNTHNPFAINDIYFSRQTGWPIEEMNLYGSSLVYGHPQGPTGARGIVELIETLIRRGGGLGLFTGCAAGDTAAAVVIRVDG